MSVGPKITVAWNAATRAQWRRLVRSAGKSALEQSWDYGAAVAAQRRFAVTRAVVSWAETPLALVQVFGSGLLPGLRLARITRGPVWLDGNGDAVIRAGVVRAIRSEFGLARRNFLLWLPELPDTPASAATLRSAGMRRMVTGYGSIWLDLTPDEDSLRGGLDGKWRNALVNAERGRLKVDTASTGSALDGLLGAYDGMRRARRFVGPASAFVRVLADFARRDDDLFLLRAMMAGEMVSGALFVRHGASATYLVGWTGAEGRRQGGGQLVLWSGALMLKRAGLRWLDLGGIDAAQPGIARFKLGLGGSPYTLTGTWL